MRTQTHAGHPVVVSITLILLLAACTPDPGSTPMPPAPGELVKSELPRNFNPNVANLDELVTGNNEFAFDLYQNLINQEDVGENLFYSPHSITMAMAMAWGGARNNTSDEIQTALHYTLGQSGTHEALNALDLELASRGQGAKGADGKAFRLNVLNATFGQQDYAFENGYLDLLAVNYGAGLNTLDFRGDAEGARVVINDWVEDATEDRIEELIPPGVINSLTRLVLTNAIYFNAQWRDVFSVDATLPGDFTKLDGTTVTADLMHNRSHYGYASADGIELVELPYDGDELSMVILLPAAGTFESWETSLTSDFVSSLVANIETGDIMLTLPKFKYDYDLPLKRHLAEMGIVDAFDENRADFTGINGGVEPLYVQDVLHKAFIGVNEFGTEAAAATAVVIGTTSLPPEVKVDRPFIYLVRDIETGAILFVGRVLDPTI